MLKIKKKGRRELSFFSCRKSRGKGDIKSDKKVGESDKIHLEDAKSDRIVGYVGIYK